MTTDSSSAVLYALPSYRVQPIDGRSLMLLRLDSGAVAALDARWQPFLGLLETFRTLAEHAQVIASRVPELRGQEAALTGALEQLVPRGVFISSDEVLARLAPSDNPPPPSPVTVCIRTCDRPQLLERLLASLQANADTFAKQRRYEVIDDSRQPASIQRNRQLIEQFSRTLHLEYVGRAEQQALIDALCAELPEDTHALRWLLDSEHPDHADQPTYGVLYNQLFLRHAGQRILMLDDDAVLKAWQHPDTEWTPWFALGAGIGTAYTQADSAFAELQPYSADPLDAHVRALGGDVGSGIAASTGEVATQSCLHNSAFVSAPHPYALDGRIRYTLNGLLGDTGSTTDHLLLYYAPELIPQIIESDERYHRLRTSPRCAFTGTRRGLLTGVSHFHHTTCAGLALDPLIAPVIPIGRGEDAMLGNLLSYLYPEDFGLRLPFGLEHWPEQPRPWALAPEQIASPPSACSVMTMWLATLRAPVEVTPQARLHLLGESLAASADSGVLSARVQDLIQRRLHETLIDQFAITQQSLAVKGAISDAWRHEITKISQWLAKRLHDSTALLPPQQIDALAATIQRYGETLGAWERAFRVRTRV